MDTGEYIDKAGYTFNSVACLGDKGKMNQKQEVTGPPAFPGRLFFAVLFLMLSHRAGNISAGAASAAGRPVIAPGRGFYIVLELPALAAALTHPLTHRPSSGLDNPVMPAAWDILLFSLSSN
jgi:hypothetical protein